MKTTHVYGLDALRGIAILGVIFYHLMPGRVPGGFLGVNMFFVLSGYLIYQTSVWEIQRGEYSVINFYRKRCRRILPNLCAMVCVVIVLMIVFFPEVANGKICEVISIFGGYNNLWQMHQKASYFARIGQQSPFTHLWAMAIEMQFYFIWPFLFALMRKLKKNISWKGVKLLVLIGVVIGGIWMSILFKSCQDVSRLYYGTDTRLFALMLGIFTAMVQKEFTLFLKSRLSLWVRNGLLLLTLGIFVSAYFWVEGQMDYVYLGGLFIFSMICAVIILLLSCSSFKEILENSLLTGIGKISYELYLWMYPVIFLFAYQKKNYGVILWGVQLTLIFLIAYTQYLIKRYFISKKNTYRQEKYNLARYIVCNFVMTFFVFVVGMMISKQPWVDFTNQTQKKVNAMYQTNSATNKVSTLNKGSKIANMEENVSGNLITESTSLRVEDVKVTAIGDSVLLGADSNVEKQIPNCIVDAKESRQVSKARIVVEELKEKEELGDIVIIALGTNGTFSAMVGEKLIDAIGQERQIYWVTVFGQRLQWQEDSNHMIWSMEKKYSNVHVIDWAAEANEHSEWFLEDGVHLTESGCEAYAQLLSASIFPNKGS